MQARNAQERLLQLEMEYERCVELYDRFLQSLPREDKDLRSYKLVGSEPGGYAFEYMGERYHLRRYPLIQGGESNAVVVLVVGLLRHKFNGEWHLIAATKLRSDGDTDCGHNIQQRPGDVFLHLLTSQTS